MSYNLNITIDSVLTVPKTLIGKEQLLNEYVCKSTYEDVGKIELFSEEDECILLPVTAVSKFKNYPIIDRRTLGRKLDAHNSVFIPREGQQETVETVTRKLESPEYPDQGLLIAGCGKGKTVMATEIALRLGRSTCILVHKDYLADQWRAALKLLAPNKTMGRVKQDVCETGNEFDFVVVSTQSLTSSSRVYSSDFFKSFGTLVVDEVHRYGAGTWHKALVEFPTKYRLGLTATDTRFDGLWGVITAHLGEELHRLSADNVNFKCYMVSVKTKISPKSYSCSWCDNPSQRKKMQRAKLLTKLATHPGRNKSLAKNLIKAYNSGRHVMIISDRKDQLNSLINLCKEEVGEKELGLFVGGLSKKKQGEALSKRFLFTTYSMSNEALDVPRLDTLFLVTPRAHIEQTVGRILRQFEGKKLPTVFDPVDVGIPEASGWAYSRLKEYSAMGAEVEKNFERT